MATRISDLTALASGLKKNDKFEMCKTDEGKSYSCTPEDILNYCKNTANGAFRGVTSESLDNLVTKEHVGVWQWSGSDGPNGTASGILEVITHEEITNGNAYDIIQRLTNGPFVYQRCCIDANWSSWSSLRNVNGCAIKYGVSNSATTEYSDTTPRFSFSSTPSVICIPLNTSAEAYANIINVTAVSPTEFTVVRYRSSLTSVVTKETTTVDENTGAGTKTTTTTIETTRGEWEAADFSYYWIALLEEG